MHQSLQRRASKKKCLKILVSLEEQREKIPEEIEEENKKIVQMQQQLDEVRAATKEYDVGRKTGHLLHLIDHVKVF